MSHISSTDSSNLIATLHSNPDYHHRRSWQWLTLFFMVYFLIWSIAPAFITSSVPLDVSEGINWGSEFQWGYYKHPPLSSWILYSFYEVFGHIGPYLLSQLFVILTLILVFLLARQVTSYHGALLASASTMGVIYYSYPSLEFNHNVAQFPIWAGLSLLFFKAITNNRYRDWIGVGVVGGLGMLTKYSVIFLLIPMAIFLILPAQWRLLKQSKPWLAAVIMLALFSPHLYWLTQHDWLPLTYASGRSHDSNEVSQLSAHFSWLGFTLTQLIAHVPLLIMLVMSRQYLKWPPLSFQSLLRSNDATTAAADLSASLQTPQYRNLSLLWYLWLSPLVLLILLSLILGLGLRDMWAMPMWSLSGIILVSLIGSRHLDQVAAALSKYLTIWLGLVTLLMLIYLSFGHQLRDKPSRMDWPEQALAAQAHQSWLSVSNCPLDSVSGDRWLGALVAMNTTPAWPSQMISGPADHSPWMTSARLQQHGTLVLAEQGADVNLPLIDELKHSGKIVEQHSSPGKLTHYQGVWSVTWPQQPDAKPLVIKWEAYVPSQCTQPIF